MTADLERLDAFLSSDESPEHCLSLSDLDGFLHGVACSPVSVPSEEWMSVALGGEPDHVPAWVLQDIASILADICDGLKSDPPVIEPVFWESKEGHVVAMDWCEGFMTAVTLRQEAWKPFVETREGAQLILPIMLHVLDENGNSRFGIAQEDLDDALDQAAEAIPTVVPAMHRLLANQTLH